MQCYFLISNSVRVQIFHICQRSKLLGKGRVEPLGLELLSYSVFSDEQLLYKGYLVYFTFHCTATFNIPHIFLIGFVIQYTYPNIFKKGCSNFSCQMSQQQKVFIKIEKQITLFNFDLCEIFTLDTFKHYCQISLELY